jgi:flagellar biosynthesis/type III secretory pathway protein FliH
MMAAMATQVNSRNLTPGQRAYEAKRAAKAGVSLEKWLAEKDREAEAAAREAAKAAREAARSAKPQGFFSRLIEKAHKPL